MQRVKNIFKNDGIVVIKVGTNLLAEKTKGINTERLRALAKSIMFLRT